MVLVQWLLVQLPLWTVTNSYLIMWIFFPQQEEQSASESAIQTFHTGAVWGKNDYISVHTRLYVEALPQCSFVWDFLQKLQTQSSFKCPQSLVLMRQVDPVTSVLCWDMNRARREEVKGDEGRIRRRPTSFLRGFVVGCTGSGLSLTHSVSLFLLPTGLWNC